MCVYCVPATAPSPSNNGFALALKGGEEDDILNVKPGPRELSSFYFEINEVFSVFLEWKAIVKEKVKTHIRYGSFKKWSFLI